MPTPVSTHASPVLSFFVCLGYTAMNETARELEMPFGLDPNDLNLTEYQRDFNDKLVQLLDQTIPNLGYLSLGRPEALGRPEPAAGGSNVEAPPHCRRRTTGATCRRSRSRHRDSGLRGRCGTARTHLALPRSPRPSRCSRAEPSLHHALSSHPPAALTVKPLADAGAARAVSRRFEFLVGKPPVECSHCMMDLKILMVQLYCTCERWWAHVVGGAGPDDQWAMARRRCADP